MKHFLMFFLASVMVCNAFAQKEKEEKEQKNITPPTVVKTAFEQKFKGAGKVKWEKEKVGYEVNFQQDGKEMSAVYDAKGSLQETEWEIKTSELPPAVAVYIKDHYKGVKIKEAAKIVKSNGETNYEAEINGKDVVFDATGKFIKEEKD